MNIELNRKLNELGLMIVKLISENNNEKNEVIINKIDNNNLIKYLIDKYDINNIFPFYDYEDELNEFFSKYAYCLEGNLEKFGCVDSGNGLLLIISLIFNQ